MAHAVLANVIGDIDRASSVEELDVIMKLAYEKFAAFKDSVAVYEEYVVALELDTEIDAEAKAEIALKMALSYDTTMKRVVASTNVDDILQNVKFIRDELDSLYPLA